jgi:hypothetical protein
MGNVSCLNFGFRTRSGRRLARVRIVAVAYKEIAEPRPSYRIGDEGDLNLDEMARVEPSHIGVEARSLQKSPFDRANSLLSAR